MQNLLKLSDESLVNAYAKGNDNAFDTLLSRHKDRIYGYILHIVKNPEFANDIFQETFVKIIMLIREGKYVDSGKFLAWANRIARNLIIDNIRQEKPGSVVSIDAEDTDVLNKKDLADVTIEDKLILSQIHTDVRRLIEALPDSQREVIELRFFKNMSFKEIAEATGVSINTALGRMRYALIHLRKLSKDYNIALTV